MKREAYRHPKLFDLAAKLGISRAAAIGHLELLWDWTGDVAPQGDIGKWPDTAIAGAADWTGDPSSFVDALVSARWLDRSNDFRLVIHDWPDHCQEWIRKKLFRSKSGFCPHYGQTNNADSAPVSRQCLDSVATFAPPSNPSLSNPIQTDAARTKKARFNPPTMGEVRGYCETAGIDIDAQRFIDHYTANGWKVGRSAMKDWQAAVRNWAKNDFNRNGNGNASQRASTSL
jgi:hypothetical protein